MINISNNYYVLNALKYPDKIKLSMTKQNNYKH